MKITLNNGSEIEVSVEDILSGKSREEINELADAFKTTYTAALISGVTAEELMGTLIKIQNIKNEFYQDR